MENNLENKKSPEGKINVYRIFCGLPKIGDVFTFTLWRVLEMGQPLGFNLSESSPTLSCCITVCMITYIYIHMIIHTGI